MVWVNGLKIVSLTKRAITAPSVAEGCCRTSIVEVCLFVSCIAHWWKGSGFGASGAWRFSAFPLSLSSGSCQPDWGIDVAEKQPTKQTWSEFSLSSLSLAHQSSSQIPPSVSPQAIVVMYLTEHGRERNKWVGEELGKPASPELWHEAAICHNIYLHWNPALYYVNIFSV